MQHAMIHTHTRLQRQSSPPSAKQLSHAGHDRVRHGLVPAKRHGEGSRGKGLLSAPRAASTAVGKIAHGSVTHVDPLSGNSSTVGSVAPCLRRTCRTRPATCTTIVIAMKRFLGIRQYFIQPRLMWHSANYPSPLTVWLRITIPIVASSKNPCTVVSMCSCVVSAWRKHVSAS